MGTIRQRNQQWNAQVRIKGWRPLSKTFPNKRLAKEWIDRTETAIRSKEFGLPDDPNMTLASACVRYATTISATHKGATVEQHRLRKLACSFLGTMQLHELSKHHIHDYFEKRQVAVSTSTVRREFLLLKRIITVAMTEWNASIAEHPMMHLDTPKEANHRTRRLTESETK
jgi:hypothetical protein